MKSHCASVTLRISARQRDYFHTGKKLLTFRKNRVPSASVSVPLNVALAGLKSMFFRSRLIFCMACKCSHFNTQLWSKLLHAIYYILQERSFGLNLFVNVMEHLPHGWNFGTLTTLPSPASPLSSLTATPEAIFLLTWRRVQYTTYQIIVCIELFTIDKLMSGSSFKGKAV